jgi:adenine specific DNA methylase Mod
MANKMIFATKIPAPTHKAYIKYPIWNICKERPKKKVSLFKSSIVFEKTPLV